MSAQLIRCIWSEFNDGVLVPVSVARRLWARSGLSSARPGPDPGPCSHLDGKILQDNKSSLRHATHNTHTTQINNAYKHSMTLRFNASLASCVILTDLFHLSQSGQVEEMVLFTFVLFRGEDEASVLCEVLESVLSILLHNSLFLRH